ncbi:MAG TPA: cytochrome c oxidase subunit II [Candidatus Krumholzibacteria bacterium]|nr:cytochrome c oxidase subunit II [Candidatus Krumholzibacteria bacterium]
MLSRLSNIADAVNGPIIFISAVSLFMLVGITGVMLYFTFRYNRRRSPVGEDIHGHQMLEVVWTVIPTILAFAFFWYGWEGYKIIKTPPKDAMRIQVTGRMWSWHMQYANGVESNELYVPVNRAVRCDLASQDVIHSFYLPAFKVKQDAVPGVPGLFLWFIANQVGDYDIFCAEYCGTNHSRMLSKVHVLPEADFDAWLKTEGVKVAEMKKATEATGGASDETLAIVGKQLATSKGCVACHSSDGSKLIGPSYKGLYGSKQTVVSDGAEHEVTVDDAYIKKSMLTPTADVVKGFQPLMPSQQGLVSDGEIKALTAYIKSLK